MRQVVIFVKGLIVIGMWVALSIVLVGVVIVFAQIHAQSSLSRLIAGEPCRAIRSITFDVPFESPVVVSEKQDIDYLTTCLRAARKYDNSDLRSGQFTCRVSFWLSGEARCRVLLCQDRHILVFSLFMGLFDADEQWYIVELRDPIPPGVEEAIADLHSRQDKEDHHYSIENRPVQQVVP